MPSAPSSSTAKQSSTPQWFLEVTVPNSKNMQLMQDRQTHEYKCIVSFEGQTYSFDPVKTNDGACKFLNPKITIPVSRASLDTPMALTFFRGRDKAGAVAFLVTGELVQCTYTETWFKLLETTSEIKRQDPKVRVRVTLVQK